MRIPQEELYEADALFLPDRALSAFAATARTPFFLYDEATLRKRAELLQSAFAWHPHHRPFFPVKATPIPAILQILRACGFCALCTTETELRLAVRAGFTGAELLFFSGSPLPADANLAAELGAGLLLDSPEQMGFYLRNGGLREELGLRLHMDGALRVHGLAVAQPGASRFGADEARILDYARQMRACGVYRVGLHAQFGGGSTKRGYLSAVAGILCDLATILEPVLPVSYLDLGGGLEPDDDLEAEQPGIRAALEGAGLTELPLYTELGQWLTAPAAVLVTQVQRVRELGRDLQAELDLSVADLLRCLFSHKRYHISRLGNHRIADRIPYRLVGTLAYESDVFRGFYCLPALKRGDYLAVHDVGAYAGDARYGGRLASAAYLHRADGSFDCIRRAETPDDVLRLFPD